MSTNELRGGAGVNAILARRFDIENAPAQFAASELFPVVVLENDRPEYHFLAGSRLWGASGTDVAVAAQFSAVGVENPVDSGVLSIVTAVSIELDVPALFDLRVEAGALSAVDSTSATVFRDLRYGPSATRVPTTQLVLVTGAVSPGLSFLRGVVEGGVASSGIMPVDIVLAPGSRAWLTCAAVNVGVVGNFLGYERPAEKGELTGGQ